MQRLIPLLFFLSLLFACTWRSELEEPAPRLPTVDAAPEATTATKTSTPTSTSPSATGCHVKIEAVVKGEVYRGPPPPTPSQANDPTYWELYDKYSHGDFHLACEYKVRLNGALYLHEHYFNNTMRDLDESHCEASVQEVEESIRSFTDHCTDLHAGEYWGFRLKPLSP